MNQIKIIKAPTSDKPFLIIDKPSGLPTAPLTKNDTNNALFEAMELFPQIKNVSGKKEIEYGLIHRIDTVTSGLILIATDQEYYELLLKYQKENKLIKYYKANCEFINDNTKILGGFPENPSFNPEKNEEILVSSYFRFFGEGHKEVRPVLKTSGTAALKKIGKPVLYSTKIRILEKIENNLSIECEINNGFRHQVRCHLAWNNLPIKGDKLYNCKEKNNAENSIEFSAYKLNINGEVFTRKET